MGFTKLGEPLWGSYHKGYIVFWGLYWDPAIQGRHHMGRILNRDACL